MKIEQYPFFFKQWGNEYLLVNMVGEHLFLQDEDFTALIKYKYEDISEDTRIKLYSRNFIGNENERDLITELLAIKLRSRKNFISEFTSLHMVVLTLRCNGICDYCHASSKDLISKETDMSIETAKAVLLTILQSPSNNITIEFQGGEPSLNWSVLEFFVTEGEKRAKAIGKHISFVICTNLLEITNEQIDFLIQHNVSISTSCDGEKKIHNLHRKYRKDGTNTYDMFVKNLTRIRNKGYYDINALMTVTKDNLVCLNTCIDEYIKLGFNNIFIRALNPYGYALDNREKLGYSTKDFLTYYKQALMYIIEINKNGVYFPEAYASLLFKRIMTPFSTGFVDLQSPSGAGIAGAIYYYNGDVYPSDEARMLAARNNEMFKMGNVKTDNYKKIFYGDVIKRLVKESCVECMPGCSTCVFNQYCGADPIRYYSESGKLEGKRYNSDFFFFFKGIINIIFYIIHQNDEQTMSILWSWVNRKPLGEE